MKVGIIAVAIVSVAAMGTLRETRAGGLGLPLRQAPAPSSAASSRSVWDGVYTQAQQQRGEAIYIRECSTCHGERLRGGEGSPPLTGPDFSANWNGQTVADLFDRIRLTMPAPPDQPGKLSLRENADVVAHILSANSFPAGRAAELPTEIDQLKQIRITTKP